MLHISLLGEQVIRDATGVVRTRSSRTLALVGFLAVHAGAPQPRQRIAALFWPDSSDEQALTNLRRELHHLRQTVDDEPALVVTARDLCWRDSATCVLDVRTFDLERAAARAARSAGDDEAALAHAAAAAATYHGEFLPGGYDDWILDARSEREQHCVELLDLICTIRTRTSDLTGAVDAARRRIQLRPLEEIGYRTLIELHGERGDRAGAVNTFHRCASVLERELGVEPGPDTRAALDRLLSRVGPAPAATAPEPAPHRSGLASAHLVGRARELGLLHDLWRRTVDGRPGLALVRGDAGVGKTRLVADLAELARQQSAAVASAQCFGSSGRLALSPVADWLRAPAVQAGMATLDPVWRIEVERLVPSGRARGEPGFAARAMVDAWQRHRFFEGLARALIDVGRPTLLILDNLHWCDQETLAFLSFCLGLAGAAPIMVAATVRNDDADAGVADWIARMRASGMLTELAVHPLDTADTARLAEAISATTLSEDDATLLQATTGGFPLYIVESARGSVERGGRFSPDGDTGAVLRSRLDHVSAAAREVAGLAAAVGRNFALDLLTEASDLDADIVVRAVDELWRHRILRETSDGYDFSHDLLREAAYASVTPPKRWLLHRRIAQGLELLHADDPDTVSAQLAEQYARGGRGERAVGYYRRAAEVAARMFAHTEAIRLHEQALAIVRKMPEGSDRNRRELELLESLAAPLNAQRGYSSPELRATLERSIELAERLGRRESVVTALVGLWTSQFVRGHTMDAHRTATRALELVEPGSVLSGPAHFAVAGSSISLGRPADALEHFAHLVTFGSTPSLSVGTRPDVHGRAFVAHAHWLLGHTDEARLCAAEAVALARTTDTPYSLAVALAYGAITFQLSGELGALDEAVSELRALCDRYDFAYYREWVLILAGWSAGGEPGYALARRGVDNLTAHGAFARMPYWLALVADLAQRVGNAESARATLDAALVGAAARDDVWWLPEVMRMRARYDDADSAVVRLDAAARLARAHGSLALVERCAADLAARGVRRPARTVRATRRPTANAARTPAS